MLDNLEKRIMSKILDNCNYSSKKGMIIASPSNDPPYKFHWIRDSALVMRVFIDLYERCKEDKYFIYLLNYIENETLIQNLKTLTSLGEPKIKIDRTPYNDPWGRPQNDGPALRGINMIRIYKLLKNEYTILGNTIKSIIKKDLNYILENYDKPCFDLWEEYFGWHFYTRLVQVKFLKDCMEISDELELDLNVKNAYDDLTKKIEHHLQLNKIVSSFDENGKISKSDDASILLAFSHINYDSDILKIVKLEYGINNCKKLLDIFRKKYNKYDLNMIGRYENDQYYNGHVWIICTLGLLQFYVELFKNNKEHNNLLDIVKKEFDFILSIDISLDLAEQYDPINDVQLSAKKLTWNYSELYMTYKAFKSI